MIFHKVLVAYFKLAEVDFAVNINKLVHGMFVQKPPTCINVYASVSSGARCLKFGLSLYL